MSETLAELLIDKSEKFLSTMSEFCYENPSMGIPNPLVDVSVSETRQAMEKLSGVSDEELELLMNLVDCRSTVALIRVFLEGVGQELTLISLLKIIWVQGYLTGRSGS